MRFMPFTDDQQPIYADEAENLIFRVKDVKDLLETHIQLPLTKLVLLGSDDDPHTLEALYKDLAPDRVWYLEATFTTPEGAKKAEVFLMLKERQLHLPRRIFPRLETFLHTNREQAQQNIPDLTLDYILTLEDVVSDTWRFWRDLVYFLDRHHSEGLVGDLKNQFKHQIDTLYKDIKRVGFLNTSDGDQDPFPGGL